MYYPYFRGKQFELLAIRDTANVMAEAGFTPIIEPVREALNGLERTLKTIKKMMVKLLSSLIRHVVITLPMDKV